VKKIKTENMEVHHHSKVEKKNFKEYFLEFLMIFLAVTLGFFAENIREHLSDNAKEREYIQSLAEDLKVDQQILSQNISSVQSGISMMDSLIIILDNPSSLSNNTGELYYLARLSPRLQPLAINDKTFQQLKNSGNFRLIKNISASNKIMEYYNTIPLVRLLESINETEFTQYKTAAAKIFNPEIFISTEGEGNEIKRINGNPPLRTTDNELLQELSVFAVYMHGTKKGVLDADEKMKQAGAELIDFLKKEYHLKDE
jgi:polyphosphate kinase